MKGIVGVEVLRAEEERRSRNLYRLEREMQAASSPYRNSREEEECMVNEYVEGPMCENRAHLQEYVMKHWGNVYLDRIERFRSENVRRCRNNNDGGGGPSKRSRHSY